MVMGLREMERRLLELERRAPIDGKDVVFERGPRGAVPICKRTCPKGGKSGAVCVPVRITGIHPDTPTGDDDVRIFRGDAYANGSEVSASTTGVTIRIMGLAAGVDEYPTLPVMALPISQSWTNASGETVTEAVYEAAVTLWT